MEISQNSSAIQLYAGDDLIRAKQWATLDPSELRRRAYAACRDRDVDELWALTEAFMVLHGSAGAHISPHTKAAYKRGVAVLVEQWSSENLTSPSRDAAAIFVRSLEKSGLKPATVTVRLAAARMLYKALRWAGVLETDPLADVRPARDPTPAWSKRQPYSDSDVERLLLVCVSPHDRALTLLCSHAGLRISEALALQWPDIDLEAKRLTVQHGKGNKKRICPLSRRLADTLRDMEQPDGYLLPYRTSLRARQRMQRLCTEAGVRYLGLHSLRHQCGVKLYRASGKLEVVQELLGHSNISTTQIYTHLSSDVLEQSIGDW